MVAHVATDEAADEVRLARVEETEVVGGGRAGVRVDYDEGVVAEAFEEDLAGLHRGYADAGGGGEGLGGQQAQQGDQQAQDQSLRLPPPQPSPARGGGGSTRCPIPA